MFELAWLALRAAFALFELVEVIGQLLERLRA
jgi:hypothetical protein